MAGHGRLGSCIDGRPPDRDQNQTPQAPLMPALPELWSSSTVSALTKQLTPRIPSMSMHPPTPAHPHPSPHPRACTHLGAEAKQHVMGVLDACQLPPHALEERREARQHAAGRNVGAEQWFGQQDISRGTILLPLRIASSTGREQSVLCALGWRRLDVRSQDTLDGGKERVPPRGHPVSTAAHTMRPDQARGLGGACRQERQRHARTVCSSQHEQAQAHGPATWQVGQEGPLEMALHIGDSQRLPFDGGQQGGKCIHLQGRES